MLSRITENNTRMRKEFGINSPILEDPIQNGDILSVYSASSVENIIVELRGEFRFPGFYNVSSSETLSGLIERAGGLTELAYPLGAIFTRESVAATQKTKPKATQFNSIQFNHGYNAVSKLKSECQYSECF